MRARAGYPGRSHALLQEAGIPPKTFLMIAYQPFACAQAYPGRSHALLQEAGIPPKTFLMIA